MPRSRTMSFISLATLGRCSLILMPETAVSICLKALPSLRSQVWDWAGPPCIHSRMQDLCLVPWLAALAALLARTSNHPEVETPSAPAAVSFSKSRRESCSRNMEYSPSSDAQGLQPLG